MNRQLERVGYGMDTTKNNLAEPVRTQIIELCNARLADAVDLQLQCKYAQWNVKGSDFIALHEFFHQVHEDVEHYADRIAERTVQLGGIANSTEHIVATWVHLADFNTQNAGERAFLQTLASALASFGSIADRARDKCDELGDVATAEMFTEISLGVEELIYSINHCNTASAQPLINDEQDHDDRRKGD
jgi:starvation-inducible DNA-binding protein